MKRFFLTLSLVVLGSVSGLLLCEILLRLFDVSYLNPMVMDEARAQAMAPNIEGWYRDEGEAWIKTNSLGYRDIERSFTKPKDVYRIAVIGDSFTAGLSVASDELFTSIMESQLNDCLENKSFEKKIEVMNFGVPGYAPTQEFITLTQDALRFSPDAVLLAFYTANDIEFLDPKSPPFHPFHFFKEGKLILDETFKSNSIYQDWLRNRKIFPFYEHLLRLKKNSRLWQLLDRVRRGKMRQNKEDAGIENLLLQAAYPLLYRDESLPLQNESWENLEGIFRLFQDTTKKNGIRFWLATLSNEPQVYPDIQVRDSIANKLKVTDLFYPDRKIKMIGEKNNIPVIPLATKFADIAAQKKIFFHGFTDTRLGFGHWNHQGHKLAGEIISEKICKELSETSSFTDAE